MTTFAEKLEQTAEPDTITHATVGHFGWCWGDEEGSDCQYDECPDEPGRLLPWAEARTILDYEWVTRHGSPRCHAVVAWTSADVLFVVQYDGMTWIESVPRTPTTYADGDVPMPGQ